MTFHVGQRVVCVDDVRGPGWTHDWVSKGSIYTVRWIGRHKFPTGLEYGVRLQETKKSRFDSPFFAHRFRPVRDTDISIFTSMLSPAPTDKVSA